MRDCSLPRKASSTVDLTRSTGRDLTDAEVDLVCESLRMMAEQLLDASATVSRVMPEAQILERFADWREQALDLRDRLQM